ncbi:MAG: PIN domain-containing protein [Anaerolineales bacterium]|nr:PIN domain-containing protein [Anaerolineales bacterium]
MKARIFIDSSVLFSAANSKRGHSRDLVIMSARGELVLVLSHYVLEETRRNLANLKEPKDIELELLLSKAEVEIATVDKDDVLHAAQITVLKDAPIIAAAKKAKVTILVSLDRKHILRRPDLETYINAPILTPKEAFQKIKTS